MGNEPKFTIVTPAYQTEPFIDKMVESVKAQTFGDFECILVVEESKDKSLERCQAISREDERFKTVSLPKSGSGSASKNYGIREAKGEYIVFVDGDDWIEPQSLELFSKAIDSCGGLDVLLVSGRSLYQDDNGDFQIVGRMSNISKADEGKIVTGRQMIVRVGRAQNYPVLNICRAEFLRSHELYFAVGLQQEDTEWTPRVWFYAERVSALDFEFYNYRRWSGSVQSSCSPKLLLDFSQIVNLQFDFHDTHDIPEDILNVWRNQWISMIYWYFFHPLYVKKFERDVRIKALDNIMGDEHKWERFFKIAKQTSLPKRLAIPLVKRAAMKHDFHLADAYFRFFYFPLVKILKK